MAFCPKCGKEVLSNAVFCPSCGSSLGNSSPLPSPLPVHTAKRPNLGFLVLLIGVAIIFLSAVVYLAVGVPVAGVVGIVFAIVATVFGRRAHRATDGKEMRTYGTIPLFIGLIIMIVDGPLLNFDIGVLLGGLMMMLGGVMVSSGK
jgi:hypothetical protein